MKKSPHYQRITDTEILTAMMDIGKVYKFKLLRQEYFDFSVLRDS